MNYSKTIYLIIFSLIFGYIFFNVYISENFTQRKKRKVKHRVKRRVKRRVKPHKLPSVILPEVPSVILPEIPLNKIGKLYEGPTDFLALDYRALDKSKVSPVYRCNKPCNNIHRWKQLGDNYQFNDLYITNDGSPHIYGINNARDVVYKCPNFPDNRCNDNSNWMELDSNERDSIINKFEKIESDDKSQNILFYFNDFQRLNKDPEYILSHYKL